MQEYKILLPVLNIYPRITFVGTLYRCHSCSSMKLCLLTLCSSSGSSASSISLVDLSDITVTVKSCTKNKDEHWFELFKWVCHTNQIKQWIILSIFVLNSVTHVWKDGTLLSCYIYPTISLDSCPVICPSFHQVFENPRVCKNVSSL